MQKFTTTFEMPVIHKTTGKTGEMRAFASPAFAYYYPLDSVCVIQWKVGSLGKMRRIIE